MTISLPNPARLQSVLGSGRYAFMIEWAARLLALLASCVLLFERSPRRAPLLYLAAAGVFLFLVWFARPNRRNYALWASYIISLLTVSMLRPYADETGMTLHLADLADLEASLFGGTIPTIWLQDRLFDPGRLNAIDWFATQMHWSYFFVPHIMTILVFFFWPQHFERQALTIAGVFLMGLAIYYTAPAAPPWYAAQVGELPQVFRIMDDVGAQSGPVYSTGYNAFGQTNPVAAIPSLHMAVTFSLVLLARHISPRLALGMLVYSVAMGFSLVYLGEHYVVDLLLGVVLAAIIYLLVESWLAARERIESSTGGPG
jgi:membrane-associated phospholipid phosphatase